MPTQAPSVAKAQEEIKRVSHARGLEVKHKTVIKKTRRLPTLGKVLVKRGDVVTPETVVARASVRNSELRFVKVYAILEVDPRSIKRYMLKGVGEEVKKNEVIALHKYLFGLLKSVCKSPIDGMIEDISNVTGRVLIRGRPILFEVKAYVPGRVISIMPEEGVVIESTAAFIQATFGIGGETHGDLAVVVDSPNEVLSPDKINGEHTGKVLVGGSLVPLGTLRKAVETGVKGIISGGIEQKELVNFLGYEIGVGITGDEEVGLTLILTEGFGKIPMNHETFQLLKSFVGKQACINGSTQIRLGVIRPEIILPLTRKDKS